VARYLGQTLRCPKVPEERRNHNESSKDRGSVGDKRCTDPLDNPNICLFPAQLGKRRLRAANEESVRNSQNCKADCDLRQDQYTTVDKVTIHIDSPGDAQGQLGVGNEAEGRSGPQEGAIEVK